MHAKQTETELIIWVPAHEEDDLYEQIAALVMTADEKTLRNTCPELWKLYELLGEQQTRRA